MIREDFKKDWNVDWVLEIPLTFVRVRETMLAGG